MTNYLKPLALSLGILLSVNTFAADQSLQITKDEIKTLASYAKISENDLILALNKANKVQKIIDTMDRPYEAKPWYVYEKAFVIKARVDAAKKFYIENKDIFDKVELALDVEPALILAIMAVETNFGRNMGSFNVLDALYTLGFHYPKRSAYFSKEFANFVYLAKRENWSYDNIKGSYAGAMGMGQFMPSSYINFAIDFNDDKHIDLFYSKEDAIGSIANYFLAHGYANSNEPYFVEVLEHNDLNFDQFLNKEMSVSEFYDAGIATKIPLPLETKATLYKFEVSEGKFSYILGLNNFKAVLKYNKSPLYARAVTELKDWIYQEINL